MSAAQIVAVSAALRDWVAWCEANAQASAEETWQRYWEIARPALASIQPASLGLRVQPAWRPRAALSLCRAALARLELEAWPHPDDGREEARLWEMALTVSPRAVAAWEKKNWQFFNFAVEEGIFGVRHRLADLARRAGHFDAAALSLYIESFYGSDALRWQKHSLGGENDPAQLLERGARITPEILRDAREAHSRYGLCLRLALQGFSAGWLLDSLQITLPTLRASPLKSGHILIA